MQCAQKIAFLTRLTLRCLASCLTATIAIGISNTFVPAAFANDEHEHRHNHHLGPGCAPDRPAVAHHAGGVMAETDQDEISLVPCTTRTGFRTSEVSIEISNDAAVLVQPALAEETGFPIGLLRSDDRGASWDFLTAADPPPRTRATDMNIWVDRQTG